MAKQWALLIGINQYKALQPLMYAQSDAIAVRNFFVDELGVPVNHCTLLTDLSAAIEPHAYMPLRQEIEQQLVTLCTEKVEPGDLLWVYFSGCGLAEGGQDYWLTLDSEPLHLGETAIALTQIFSTLAKAKTDQILLVMDMNRSQGAVGHRDIGTQTLTLANDYGITTFLSCQPNEFSHETMYLRHGLFTKALLEGLRYHGCITASQLAAYVSDRVPELCEHHCRPPQTPVTVIPPTQKFMMVVPSESIANLSVTERAAANLGLGAEGGGGTIAPPLPLTNVPSPTSPMPIPVPGGPFDEPADADASDRSRPAPAADSALVHRPAADDDDEAEGTLSEFWKWGAIAAALAFLAGVFLRYQPVLFSRGGGDRPAPPAEVAPPAPDDEPAAMAPAPAEVAPAAPDNASPEPEATPGNPLFPPEVDPLAPGETPLQRAEAAIAASRFGEARAWLGQVPPEQQNETYQALVEQANSEVAAAAIRNRDLLNNARQIIQPASASRFNDAIEQARQVPPEDPYYEQAQADIARWSQVILDLAEGRAAGGDINGAIAAARLVPDDQPAIAAQAQQRIVLWEQQIANQNLIQQTQNTLQPGQASSFNDAIETLRQITPDQPSYEAARARIQQWSEDILAIARARAAQGNLPGAIAAAQLVPDDTPAYGQAQEEIQRWQAQP